MLRPLRMCLQESTCNGSNGISIFASIRFRGRYDAAARIDDMDRFGLDCQIPRSTIPNIDFLPAPEAADWARRLNDHFAEVCRRYPDCFHAYPTVSYQDIDEAQRELERAYFQLGNCRAYGCLQPQGVGHEQHSRRQYNKLFKLDKVSWR